MAPWDCGYTFASLTYVTTLPGNPENPVSGSPLWAPGQPPPPWSYEYQYPANCLRACKILPQFTTQAGGVPLYPVGTVTGAGQVGWTGPALKFKVSTDQFFCVETATVVSGGSGYNVGDLIVLAQPTFTFNQNVAPVGQALNYQAFTFTAGAPAILQVLTLSGTAVATVAVVDQIQGETQEGGQTLGGSYFSSTFDNPNPVAQQYSINATNPGQQSGSGATFNLTWNTTQNTQRVILTNQDQAILAFIQQVTDPNVMDPMFQEAWVQVVGAGINYQLAGDKGLSNMMIAKANDAIMQARKVDGNEGITVNDITPDFLRIRGSFGMGPNFEYSPNIDFDWGAFWSPY